MPVPKNAVTIASVQIPLPADLSGVTELRVHGVGGTPPDALLDDLAPEQVAGDRIAGFYRTSDHKAVTACDTDRHVECYSWGGLTSRSRSRVLWLVLLPFMLGNLAGWMCSPQTRKSPWRFALHRASAALGALALTVNVALVAVMITADVLAYQAVRAGLAGHQWWLAPLRWPQIKGHPSRQVLIGVLAVAALMLTLHLLARQARQRYEAVPPPSRVGEESPARPIAAAALDFPQGLANKDFWNGDLSVRLLVRLHVAVAVGFLAIVLDITARALASAGGGSPHGMVWWWVAVWAGGAAVALALAYLCADAVWAERLADSLRDALAWLVPAVAAVALGSAGIFAWFQPGRKSALETAASLPGLASVIEWTGLGLAVPVAMLGASVLLGAGGRGKRLFGGPWVTLVLGYSVLNVVMLGVLIWLARIVGPVTTDAAAAVRKPHSGIYVPHLIIVGIPLVALGAVAAVIVFGLAEALRRRSAPPVPSDDIDGYRSRAEGFMAGLNDAQKPWYETALSDRTWEPAMARAHWLSRAPLDAAWLMWGVVLLQLAVAICIWQFPWEPPLYLRNAAPQSPPGC